MQLNWLGAALDALLATEELVAVELILLDELLEAGLLDDPALLTEDAEESGLAESPKTETSQSE